MNRLKRQVPTAIFAAFLIAGCTDKTMETDDYATLAQEIAQKYVLVDGHVDIPYRIMNRYEDISQRTLGGDFDFVRAKEGGIDAPFMSIYIAKEYQKTGGAKEHADELIDMVESFQEKWPDKFAIAMSPADVRANFEKGIISLPLGMENGAGLEDDLSNLEYFRDRGIRYVTLTHGWDNLISDSSYDTTNTWMGLSPFGKEVVREMNRVGIMIDVSHVSDNAFRQAVEISGVPVIASHSSMRHFTPGWQRNMDDDLLQLLAAKGGVVMINFGSSFLQGEYQELGDPIVDAIGSYMEENGIDPESDEGYKYYSEQRTANPIGTVADVVAHIDHAVNLVGVDHVGLGSDYDGVTFLPAGLQDVSEYPNLIEALLRNGYTESDIAKIMGENILRVWAEVEATATK
ncbi:MAG: membrane dipeptidase [Rhodothermales bacterium]|nr:membrane dipeptidase [Rhodothermales bacterium]